MTSPIVSPPEGSVESCDYNILSLTLLPRRRFPAGMHAGSQAIRAGIPVYGTEPPQPFCPAA
ncbi:hypothetical protein [Methanoculleus horonobensis]|uniref:hypothetical protein n=1 Tax=Methanoculleus horonobensis TaxID=528314 RepID=UPI000A3E8A29|nr:hypothetical protein [Methanoculleus horonobensis]MDD3069916.1 hypothetical protein [Methanoculleus horonobensis]MDD4253004.1 hypothetical protein [Methanoculleus horonobensis]